MYPEIDKEFSRLFGPLTSEEYETLEQSILDGMLVREPLYVWKERKILIDGHTRLRIIKKHPEVKWSIEELSFETDAQAKTWCIRKQLGRRNLSHSAAQISRVLLVQLSETKSRTEVASELGVSPRSVSRAIETTNHLKALPKDIQEEINAGKRGAGAISAKKFYELPKKEQEETVKRMRAGSTVSLADALPKAPPRAAPKIVDHPELTDVIRRMVATGKIQTPTQEVVAKFQSLSPLKKRTVEDVLATAGATSLAGAIKLVSVSNKPKAPVNQIVEKHSATIKKGFADLTRRIDALAKDTDSTGSPDHTEVINLLQAAYSRWSAWFETTPGD